MYHKPVLLEKSVDLLNIQPDGTYVDATFGSGGHSQEILKRMTEGRVIAFDQDSDVLKNIIQDNRLYFIPQNFRYLKNFLKAQGINKVDGILADLGVSSWQFDQASRGFSTRNEGRLDMRMDHQQEITAEKVLNDYPEEKLADIFYRYGELTNARKLAKQISQLRKVSNLQTTTELVSAVSELAPRGKENQFLARVFQAIRIEVNDELGALKDLLKQSADLLQTGKRMVVISYHSLEDRLVKHFFNTGNFEGKLEKDFYGNPISPFSQVIKKAITPSEEEISNNPRSRSAKLRVAERN
jgi:16S rRNA (cytosine1402-N4)-methyltransferase